MDSKRLPGLLARGGNAWGASVRSPSDFTVPILVAAGYDFLMVDCQHSAIQEGEASRMVASLVTSPTAALVRTSANDAALIGRLLDNGADGVIVPMIETAEQAAAAVAACRYAPRGSRSWGPMPFLRGQADEIEARAGCYVMIESQLGVENAVEICQTPGIAGVYVGPADLALAVGERWTPSSPPDQVVEAMRSVVAACVTAGIVPGVAGGSGAGGAWLATLGYRLISVAVDSQLLATGAATELDAARTGGKSGSVGTDQHLGGEPPASISSY